MESEHTQIDAHEDSDGQQRPDNITTSVYMDNEVLMHGGVEVIETLKPGDRVLLLCNELVTAEAEKDSIEGGSVCQRASIMRECYARIKEACDNSLSTMCNSVSSVNPDKCFLSGLTEETLFHIVERELSRLKDLVALSYVNAYLSEESIKTFYARAKLNRKERRMQSVRNVHLLKKPNPKGSSHDTSRTIEVESVNKRIKLIWLSLWKNMKMELITALMASLKVSDSLLQSESIKSWVDPRVQKFDVKGRAGRKKIEDIQDEIKGSPFFKLVAIVLLPNKQTNNDNTILNNELEQPLRLQAQEQVQLQDQAQNVSNNQNDTPAGKNVLNFNQLSDEVIQTKSTHEANAREVEDSLTKPEFGKLVQSALQYCEGCCVIYLIDGHHFLDANFLELQNRVTAILNNSSNTQCKQYLLSPCLISSVGQQKIFTTLCKEYQANNFNFKIGVTQQQRVSENQIKFRYQTANQMPNDKLFYAKNIKCDKESVVLFTLEKILHSILKRNNIKPTIYQVQSGRHEFFSKYSRENDYQNNRSLVYRAIALVCSLTEKECSQIHTQLSSRLLNKINGTETLIPRLTVSLGKPIPPLILPVIASSSGNENDLVYEENIRKLSQQVFELCKGKFNPEIDFQILLIGCKNEFNIVWIYRYLCQYCTHFCKSIKIKVIEKVRQRCINGNNLMNKYGISDNIEFINEEFIETLLEPYKSFHVVCSMISSSMNSMLVYKLAYLAHCVICVLMTENALAQINEDVKGTKKHQVVAKYTFVAEWRYMDRRIRKKECNHDLYLLFMFMGNPVYHASSAQSRKSKSLSDVLVTLNKLGVQIFREYGASVARRALCSAHFAELKDKFKENKKTLTDVPVFLNYHTVFIPLNSLNEVHFEESVFAGENLNIDECVYIASAAAVNLINKVISDTISAWLETCGINGTEHSYCDLSQVKYLEKMVNPSKVQKIIKNIVSTQTIKRGDKTDSREEIRLKRKNSSFRGEIKKPREVQANVIYAEEAREECYMAINPGVALTAPRLTILPLLYEETNKSNSLFSQHEDINDKDAKQKQINDAKQTQINDNLIASKNILYQNYNADIFSFTWNFSFNPLENFKFRNLTATLCYVNASLHCLWHMVIELRQDLSITHADLLKRSVEFGKPLNLTVQDDFADMLRIMLLCIKNRDNNIDIFDVGLMMPYEVFSENAFWSNDKKIKIIFANRMNFSYPLLYYVDYALTCFIVFTGDTKNKYESESGHYIAYRKYCQQWYFCSDNDVRIVSSTEILHAVIQENIICMLYTKSDKEARGTKFKTEEILDLIYKNKWSKSNTNTVRDEDIIAVDHDDKLYLKSKNILIHLDSGNCYLTKAEIPPELDSGNCSLTEAVIPPDVMLCGTKYILRRKKDKSNKCSKKVLGYFVAYKYDERGCMIGSIYCDSTIKNKFFKPITTSMNNRIRQPRPTEDSQILIYKENDKLVFPKQEVINIINKIGQQKNLDMLLLLIEMMDINEDIDHDSHNQNESMFPLIGSIDYDITFRKLTQPILMGGKVNKVNFDCFKKSILTGFKQNQYDIIAESTYAALRYDDLNRLVSLTAWLNDEVINYFMWMLTKRDEEICQKVPTRVGSHFFTNLFMDKLLSPESNRTNVQRWGDDIDIFMKKYIFFPINIDNKHWVLVVVQILQRRIVYYDSMDTDNFKYKLYTSTILNYLCAKWQSTKSSAFESKEWAIILMEEIPKQKNDYDCGVFICMYADYILEDKNMNFSQSDMEKARQLMFYYMCQFCELK